MTRLSDIPFPPISDKYSDDIIRDIFNTALKMNNNSEINATSRAIVDAVMKVHSALGPGHLKSTYEACLKNELSK